MVFGLFKKKEPVKVTIKSTGDEFMCEPGELLMKAALKAKIAWPLSCKVGSCGSCRATILEGEGKYPPSPADPVMLLHKEEIKRLIGLTSTKGLTLIATKVFEQNGFIKIELALAKGKKNIDKRRKITDKRIKKEIRDLK